MLLAASGVISRNCPGRTRGTRALARSYGTGAKGGPHAGAC